jgi:hypothetical protein
MQNALVPNKMVDIHLTSNKSNSKTNQRSESQLQKIAYFDYLSLQDLVCKVWDENMISYMIHGVYGLRV